MNKIIFLFFIIFFACKSDNNDIQQIIKNDDNQLNNMSRVASDFCAKEKSMVDVTIANLRILKKNVYYVTRKLAKVHVRIYMESV